MATINSFNVGRDTNVTIVTPAGVLALGLVTTFHASQEKAMLKAIGMDGKVRHRNNYHGWAGSIGVNRQDSVVDDYFAKLEADFYATGATEATSSITQTVTELNGAVSQYRYTGVLFMYDDAGTWAGDAEVKLSISFVAETRVKVA